MSATVRWLDVLKTQKGFLTDYRLAKALGLQSAHICNYRAGRSGMNDETAIRLATLLDIQPGVVLCELYAERALKRNVKRVWLDAAEKLRVSDKTSPPIPSPAHQNAA